MVLPEGRSLGLTRELLQGAIDIHVHAGPHLPSSPRRVNPYQAAIQAREAGMRAINFMDVFLMSVGTAYMVQQMVPDFQVFGGIILNTVMGSMNPRAVKTALHYGAGAKYVSFGAHSTYFQAAKEGRLEDSQFVPLSDIYPEFAEELEKTLRIPLDDEPSPELAEILDLIAQHPDVYLDTGHVSNEEALRLLDLAKAAGCARLIVSSSVTKNMTVEEQKQAVAKDAYLEHTLAGFTHTTPVPKTHYYVEREWASIDEGMEEHGSGTVKDMGDQIRQVGPEHCIIATDFGVYTLPPPVEGLREFIAILLDLGFSPDEIRTMVSTNPAKLLGLDD